MKNKLAKLLLAGTMGLGILGCSEYRTEYSDLLHEDAIVTYKSDASQHSTLNAYPTEGTGGVGIPMGGGISIIPGYQESGPEVIIESEDKTFVEHNPDLCNKLEQGQKVDVSYQEVYRAFYKDTNDDKEKELVKRKLIDYKFLDANPKGKR
jgi:hypothetical protein